jgi:hypothetical protein
MMVLLDLLSEKKESIVRKWFEAALSMYPEDSSAMFGRQKDPFANPVGNSLRVGTRAIFEGLLEAEDVQKVREQLQEALKIRAVQEFAASKALRFIFQLKEVVRGVVREASNETEFSADVVRFEERIDAVALTAFDVYVECRERLCDIRINEAKRKVSWIVEKLNERGIDPERNRISLDGECPKE